MGDSMADNYIYRDIASGEAFREHLGSLGWSKPRKNQPGFTQEYGEDLIFRAAFLYATFNHTPGNYSGIPAFYVMSKNGVKPCEKYRHTSISLLNLCPPRMTAICTL